MAASPARAEPCVTTSKGATDPAAAARGVRSAETDALDCASSSDRGRRRWHRRCEQRGHRLSRRADGRSRFRCAGAALMVGSHAVLPRHVRSPRRRGLRRARPLDLHGGRPADRPDEAERLLAEIDPNPTAALVLSSAATLRGLAITPDAPIGAVGFSMGVSGRCGCQPEPSTPSARWWRSTARRTSTSRTRRRRIWPIGPSTTSSSTTMRSSSRSVSASRRAPGRVPSLSGNGSLVFETIDHRVRRRRG